MIRELIRWFFTIGLVFLFVVGGWAVVVVTRMRREQAIAIATLNALAAKAGIQQAGDRLEAGTQPSIEKDLKVR